jgi:MOSC domain-containing protein YiiM
VTAIRGKLTNPISGGQNLLLMSLATMKVISVNVGRPRLALWRGLTVSTAIFKDPVSGRVEVGSLNLAGDKQADLAVHGGPNKAVYAYPHEHYAWWQAQLGEELVMGNFGENLTVEGLLEDAVHIGDELEIGTARFRVVQPRSPCYKLGVRFQRGDMTKRFYESRRFGFYLSVVQTGELRAQDEIRIASEDTNEVSVADVIRLYTGDREDPGLLERALKVAALPEGWRASLHERLLRGTSPAR